MKAKPVLHEPRALRRAEELHDREGNHGPAATLKFGQVLKHREGWLLAATTSAPTVQALKGRF